MSLIGSAGEGRGLTTSPFSYILRRMKRRILLVALLAALFTIPLLAQDLPEYGDASELKEVKKVYVTSEELDSRKLILWQLKRDKGTALEMVNTADDADVILEYKVMSSTEARGRQSSHYMRSELVAYRLTEGKRRRILWSDDETYEQSGGMAMSRPNEVNLTMHFVKAVRKARGEKK
jgi:hypothetical protein